MKNQNRIYLALTLSLAIAGTAAGAAIWHTQTGVLDLDAAQTKVEFTLNDVLHTVHGNFHLKSGTIRFDPTTGAASGMLVVDAASGASGSGGRDKRMHKNILESESFPEITFTPDHFQGHLAPEGDSDIELHGMFGIHGSTHELVLKTKVSVTGDQVTASTRFEVPYVQWGLKNPSTLFLRVGDKVDISLTAVGRLHQ